MKKYIKPSMEMIMLDNNSQLLAASEVYDEVGDGTGQLSKRRNNIPAADDDDDYGW